MNFNDLLADLDATVFAELADDTAAIWRWNEGDRVVPISVILDRGERSSSSNGLAVISDATVARISVSGLAKAIAAMPDAPPPGVGEFARRPAEGETLTINGRLYIVHGEAWLDQEIDGRDWLCPVTASD